MLFSGQFVDTDQGQVQGQSQGQGQVPMMEGRQASQNVVLTGKGGRSFLYHVLLICLLIVESWHYERVLQRIIPKKLVSKNRTRVSVGKFTECL